MSDPHETISAHERRRRAPLHFLAKADNARFSASLIWDAMEGDHRDHASNVSYGGDPSIALQEAFRREASISLELIVKAVVAQQIECGIAKGGVTKVRPVHDLPGLWADADLPALDRSDQIRLVLATRILYWSGRYAAPMKDKDFDKEQGEIVRLSEYPYKIARIRAPTSYSWSDVNRIYTIAAKCLWSIRSEHLPSPETD